jgi:hypothetical protein
MIGRICPKCKSTFKLSTETCPNCQLPTKYKVRVRTTKGYRTAQTSSIGEASRLEADFCREADSCRGLTGPWIEVPVKTLW